jgi:alkylation response protein AidB-like acyl-CoA dehydrogenase
MTNGMPEVRGFMLRAGEAQIIDTWHSLGMRRTDSNDVVVENVFVPTSRTFALVPEFEPSPHFRTTASRRRTGSKRWAKCTSAFRRSSRW